VYLEKEDITEFWKSTASGSWRSENWKTSISRHCLLFTIANSHRLCRRVSVFVGWKLFIIDDVTFIPQYISKPYAF